MSNSEPLSVKPIVASSSLRTLAYEALKTAITNMDIYGRPDEVRLDERKLSQDLGVSRTPVREALTVLEQEGFVRSEARRGVFVIKKNKREIVSMIHAWTALGRPTRSSARCGSRFPSSTKVSRPSISTNTRTRTSASISGSSRSVTVRRSRISRATS
jgi:DNA-binding GntR family transcriptional regulator